MIILLKMSTRFYFNMWKLKVDFKRNWLNLKEEEEQENEFARENSMDPIYWCWNCKYSEYDRH